MVERIMSPDTGQACCSTSQNRDSSWFSAVMCLLGNRSLQNLSAGLQPAALPPPHPSVLVQVSRSVLLEYQCEVEKILTSEEQLRSQWPTVGPEKGWHLFSSYIVFESTSKHSHFMNPLRSNSSAEGSWPVYVQLTNGKTYGCDFVVSATGVVPNTEPFLAGNKVNEGHRHTVIRTFQCPPDSCLTYTQL